MSVSLRRPVARKHAEQPSCGLRRPTPKRDSDVSALTLISAGMRLPSLSRNQRRSPRDLEVGEGAGAAPALVAD